MGLAHTRGAAALQPGRYVTREMPNSKPNLLIISHWLHHPLCCRAGYDPRDAVIQRFPILQPLKRHTQLQATLDGVVAGIRAKNPALLTHIGPSDTSGSVEHDSIYVWPSRSKQLQNFAVALPAAMEVYKAQQQQRQRQRRQRRLWQWRQQQGLEADNNMPAQIDSY